MQLIGSTGRPRARLAALSLALVCASGPGGAAASECGTALAVLLEETPALGGLPPDRTVLARRTLRDLVGAARRLDADGHHEACMATVDAIAKTMTDYEIDLIESEPAGAIEAAGAASPAEALLDLRDARLVPLTAEGLVFTTDDVEGNAVFTGTGKQVGEVEGLLWGPGGFATHVVIGHGGFWDMFDTRAAIPIDLVRWDRERRQFYLRFGEAALDGAPAYDAAAGDWDAAVNDAYFGRLTK